MSSKNYGFGSVGKILNLETKIKSFGFKMRENELSKVLTREEIPKKKNENPDRWSRWDFLLFLIYLYEGNLTGRVHRDFILFSIYF